jgi:hypothetical protein
MIRGCGFEFAIAVRPPVFDGSVTIENNFITGYASGDGVADPIRMIDGRPGVYFKHRFTC